MNIVYKGRRKSGVDDRKFFVRLTMRDNSVLEFGETKFLERAEEKV
jgi:hypothetical protein